jgi:hypothetical protein
MTKTVAVGCDVLRRVDDPYLAADLTADTFVAAISRRRRIAGAASPSPGYSESPAM